MTLDQHYDETVLPESAEQAVEGHRGDIADCRTPLQAESSMGGEQGLPRYIGTHAAIAQDEVGQHRKDSLARSTLHAPEGEAAEANPSIMGVAGQTAAAVTGRFVAELKADGEDKGEDKLDECLAIVEELRVGQFIIEIDREGAVFAQWFGPQSIGLSGNQ